MIKIIAISIPVLSLVVGCATGRHKKSIHDHPTRQTLVSVYPAPPVCLNGRRTDLDSSVSILLSGHEEYPAYSLSFLAKNDTFLVYSSVFSRDPAQERPEEEYVCESGEVNALGDSLIVSLISRLFKAVGFYKSESWNAPKFTLDGYSMKIFMLTGPGRIKEVAFRNPVEAVPMAKEISELVSDVVRFLPRKYMLERVADAYTLNLRSSHVKKGN